MAGPASAALFLRAVDGLALVSLASVEGMLVWLAAAAAADHDALKKMKKVLLLLLQLLPQIN